MQTEYTGRQILRFLGQLLTQLHLSEVSKNLWKQLLDCEEDRYEKIDV